MKKYFVFLCLLASSFIVAAQDNWYRINTAVASDRYDYYGTIDMDVEQLLKALKGDEYIHIKNLVYFDNQQRVKSWKEWTPRQKDEVYVRPDIVTSFHEMRGDPRKFKETN